MTKITPVQVARATGIAAGGLAIGALIAWLLKRRRKNACAPEYDALLEGAPLINIADLETHGLLAAIRCHPDAPELESAKRIVVAEYYSVLETDDEAIRLECGTVGNIQRTNELVSAITGKEFELTQGPIPSVFELIEGEWQRTQ